MKEQSRAELIQYLLVCCELAETNKVQADIAYVRSDSLREAIGFLELDSAGEQ